MPRQPAREAVTNFDEIELGYDKPAAIAEAKRVLARFDLDVSSHRCPFDVDVPRFVGQIAEGDFDAALATIREAHPFAQVMGRHCHKFCEYPFTGEQYYMYGTPRDETSTAPFISALERAAADHGSPSVPEVGEAAPTGKRVAVIGAGSAGVACAWELRRLGHDVAVYEGEDEPGGLLTTGYPPFRMPRQAVADEHDLAAWGVEVRRARVDGDLLASLVEEYDAVFLAVGRTNVPIPDDGGAELVGVERSSEFLRRTWKDGNDLTGQRVVVIGGGFGGVDVVRSAVRLGAASVEMVYRRGLDEMLGGGLGPTFADILRDEDVGLRLFTEPRRVVGEAGHVSAVELGRTERLPDRAVRSIAGGEETVPADLVVWAIGERAAVTWISDAVDVALDASGLVATDPISRRTSHPKVWAGGDIRGGKGNHGAAQDGLWAARSIDAHLTDRFDSWLEVATTSARSVTSPIVR